MKVLMKTNSIDRFPEIKGFQIKESLLLYWNALLSVWPLAINSKTTKNGSVPINVHPRGTMTPSDMRGKNDFKWLSQFINKMSKSTRIKT